jgi:hypothetical protein
MNERIENCELRIEKHCRTSVAVILRREDAEGSQNARSSHFEILRFAQDDASILNSAAEPT